MICWEYGSFSKKRSPFGSSLQWCSLVSDLFQRGQREEGSKQETPAHNEECLQDYDTVPDWGDVAWRHVGLAKCCLILQQAFLDISQVSQPSSSFLNAKDGHTGVSCILKVARHSPSERVAQFGYIEVFSAGAHPTDLKGRRPEGPFVRQVEK